MRPYQILAFFVSVVLVLLIISFFFPQDGLNLGDKINLKFLTFDEILTKDSIEYADISDIVEQPAPETSSDTLPGPVVAAVDSIPDTSDIPVIKIPPKTNIHSIRFPEGKRDLFSSFFASLTGLKENKELLRILHYGDSQIEADRITGYIRHRMQTTFGGSGCGLVPAVPLYNGKRSISQSYSDNWKRFTGFINRDASIDHRRYGALFAFSAIRRPVNIFTGDEWLEFKPSPIAYPTAKKFNYVSLILGKSDSSFTRIRFMVNDSTADNVDVAYSFRYNKLNWQLDQVPKNIRFVFGPDESMIVYGVSLDDTWGVAVDNIPLRGSSGLMFSKTDTAFLRQMYQDMNVGMLILQFGGNAVPYLKNFKQYENYFKRELRVVKKMLPKIPVLVVGPSDMSVKEKGKFITHPNLEGVRNAVRDAALDSGCAFWDMYEAMGGRNSMPSWVYAEPPLAVSDFVHFNTRGAKIIAEMLYNSFMYEYIHWQEGSAELKKKSK